MGAFIDFFKILFYRYYLKRFLENVMEGSWKSH